jgi:hypothetical protein
MDSAMTVDAINDVELSELQRNIKTVKWKKAAQVKWEELVRNPLVDQQPTTENQKNYFKNQIDMRKELLFLIRDFIEGKVTNATEFSQRLAQLHEILLIGKDGQSIYYPPTLIKKTEETIREMAGKYTLMVSAKDKEEMFKNFQAFADLVKRNQSVSADELLNTIFNFFEQENFIAEDYFFPKGNMSLFMTIMNTMLRLYGLNGIPHTNMDSSYVGSEWRDTREYFKGQVILFNPNLKLETQLPIDSAMNASVENPGGIDLNPEKINMETRGEKIQFDMPESFRNMDPSTIEGFIPVIINITPVTSIPLLLGVTEEEKQNDLSLAR